MLKTLSHCIMRRRLRRSTLSRRGAGRVIFAAQHIALKATQLPKKALKAAQLHMLKKPKGGCFSATFRVGLFLSFGLKKKNKKRRKKSKGKKSLRRLRWKKT